MNVGSSTLRGGARGCVWAISMATRCVISEPNSFTATPSSSSSSPYLNSTPLGKRSRSAKRSLASHFTNTGQQPLCIYEEPSKPGRTVCRSSSPGNVWRSLGVDQTELSLALTLPTGQSFRWKLTGDLEYTGVVDQYLITLRQTPNDVEYMLHNTCTRHDNLDRCRVINPCHEVHDSCTSADGAHTTKTCRTCHHTCVCVETHGLRASSRGSADKARITNVCCNANACHDRCVCHNTHACQTDNSRSCPVCIDQAEISLKNYFNLDTSLKDVWAPFVAADARFAALAPHMAGARLLRQRPLECLFQFICSSNNHIQRISQMVDHLAGLGPYLGTVAGFSFHAFPTLNTLAKVTEAELRKAGFGYRAKYIVGAVKELQSKEGGGEDWLYSLRASTLNDCLEELCVLPGIGPKVAACIALFSLDQHHAIPVDTHVWQIATTYITPELSGERLTAKLHAAVAEAFVKRFGKYAGWAQNVLFIAELSSHQLYLPEHLRTSREKKLKGKSRKKAKVLES